MKYSSFKFYWILGCSILGIFLAIQLFQKNINQELTYKDMANSSYISQVDVQTLQNTFKSQQDAIYYLGYSDCPWCQDALPVLYDVLEEYDIHINYIDTKEVKTNHTEDFNTLKTLLKDLVEDDKIYVPQVIVIQNGEIMNWHQGTIDDHDANERDLTTMEKEILKETYKNLLFNSGGES